jgi:hypothetical protein
VFFVLISSDVSSRRQLRHLQKTPLPEQASCSPGGVCINNNQKTKLLRWWNNANRQQNVGINPLFASRDNKGNIRATGSSGIYIKTPPTEQAGCSPGVFLYDEPKTKLLRWWDNTNRQQNVGINPLFACRDNKGNIRATGSSGIYKKTPQQNKRAVLQGCFFITTKQQNYFGGGTTPIVNKMLA